MAQGALPGDYAVSVTKREDVSARFRPGPGGGSEAAKMQEEAVEKAKKMAAPQGGGPQSRAPSARPMMGGMQGKSLIPEAYGNAVKSGLTATIGPSGNTDLKFELKD